MPYIFSIKQQERTYQVWTTILGSQKVQVLQLVLYELHFLVGSMKHTTIKISA